MWRKHRSVNEDHMKYIRNDIVKPFHVVILCYTERVQDTHDLEKHLTPPEMKSNFYEADNWKVCYKYFYVDDIQVWIKDGLCSSMRDELEDNQEDYRSLTHEDWCYLLSTIEVKDNSKRAATQFENISSARAASNSDSDGYVRILRKNKARTGVLRNNKVHNNKSPKHNGN